MNRRRCAAVACFLVLAALPVQAQDEAIDVASQPGTDITFYGHVYEWNRDRPMPMNTQFPEGESDMSQGYANPCGAPPPAPADDASCQDYTGNELFLFTTPGFVQAKSSEEFINNGRYEMLHNERGQTKDIYLDTSTPVTSTLYMSADFHGWLSALCSTACWGWDPGYFQNWAVETWVWAVPLGEAGSGAAEKPDMNAVATRTATGQVLIANGMSEPKDMWSFDETLPLEAVCGETCHTVHEFPAALEWDPDFVASGGVIPREYDIVVEFEWFQYDGQRYILSTPVAGTLWNLNTGEDYPNRVTLPVRNPIDVELVYPTFVHDKLVILSVINTPWGSYDIDQKNTRLTITDADGQEVAIDPAFLQGGIETHVSHAGHYNPIEGQWIWDYQGQGLGAGEYTVTVETVNFQGSATSSTSATFVIDDEGKGQATSTGRSGLQTFDDSLTETETVEVEELLEEPIAEKESPAPGMVILPLLGAVAALRRFRA